MRRKPIDINSTEWAEYKDFNDIPTDSKHRNMKLLDGETSNSISISNEMTHDHDNNAENGSVSQERKRYI